MKMVKSLLLGSAAGFVAVAGAQAADLPVKAKAVEYVKVCSLYGVGYYYIPGTDTCIKIGGYVRWEGYHNATAGAYPNYNASGQFTRYDNTFAMQARFRLTADVRTQTEYGTLRSYFSMGINFLNQPNEPYTQNSVTGAVSGGNFPTNATNTYGGPFPGAPGGGLGYTGNFGMALERAFVQFAGFTIGRADSFFAFYNGAAYGLVPMGLDGSSGPAGLNIFAYTWQFGNGLSASLAAQDALAGSAGVLDLSQGTFGSPLGLDTGGQQVPDIVANLRVDQAWGSAQIMGGLHQVTGRYYSGIPGTVANAAPTSGCPNGTLGITDTNACGHPGNEWGWGVGAGLTLNMPWDKKDTLSGVIAYAEGATRFVAFGAGSSTFFKSGGWATGVLSDGVFRNPGAIAGYDGSIQLTKTWGGTVAFEHYWTPSLRTSWVLGYLDVSYNNTTKALLTQNGTTCRASTFTRPATECDPDWSLWRLASRTMWNPVANLDVGLEVAYTKLNTAFGGPTIAGVAQAFTSQGVANAPAAMVDQDVWSATLRVQRSFWP